MAAVLLSGCLASGPCSSSVGAQGFRLAWRTAFGLGAASASCAAGVTYDGQFYVAWSAELDVHRGRLLGAATYPPCDDGGGCGGQAGQGAERPTRVWTVPGLDPRQVVVGREEGTDRLDLFGRPGVDPGDYFSITSHGWRQR
jgi:hypothetical protein